MKYLNEIPTFYFPEGMLDAIAKDDLNTLKSFENDLVFERLKNHSFNLAASLNSLNCLKYFLTKNIKEEVKDEALCYAAKKGSYESLVFLSSLFEKDSETFQHALYHAIKDEKMKCFDFISEKIDLGYKNSYPLYIAFFYQNFEAAHKILPYSNLNLLKPDQYGSRGRFNDDILNKTCPIFDEEIQRKTLKEQKMWLTLLGEKRLPLTRVTFSKEKLQKKLPKSQTKKDSLRL